MAFYNGVNGPDVANRVTAYLEMNPYEKRYFKILCPDITIVQFINIPFTLGL